MPSLEYSSQYWRVLSAYYFNTLIPGLPDRCVYFLNKNWGSIINQEADRDNPITSMEFEERYKLRMQLIQPLESLK